MTTKSFPDDDFSWGKFAADFVAANAERLAEPLANASKKVSVAVRTRLPGSYEKYLERVASKYGKTKTFFIRDELTWLYKYYVPLSAQCGKTEIPMVDAQALDDIGSFLVIDGSGGSGKSTLLRHVMLNEIVRKVRVPVFIELRSLNNRSPQKCSLIDEIVTCLESLDLKLDYDFILAALSLGHFSILLDGYDELSSPHQKVISPQIQKLADRYPLCTIRLASRPNGEFVGWHDFSVVTAKQLSLQQACAIVTKLPADEDIKGKFVTDLRGGLYAQHTSFLSNPLLLTIMLLTYGQSAGIPSRVSSFYSQAYTALFQGHDALKGAFKRHRTTALDLNEFADVFAAFSIHTYDIGKHEFARLDLPKLLEQAAALTRHPFPIEGFIDDVVRAVCLLVEDGAEVRFAHRSFQEYFAARFISVQETEVAGQLVQKYVGRYPIDNVIPILQEIMPNLVERFAMLPHLDRLAEEIKFKKTIGISHWLRYMKLRYTLVVLDERFHISRCIFKNQTAYRRNSLELLILRKCRELANLSIERKREVQSFKGVELGVARTSYLGEEGKVMTAIDVKKLTTAMPFAKKLFESKRTFLGSGDLEDLFTIRDCLKAARSSKGKTALATLLKRAN